MADVFAVTLCYLLQKHSVCRFLIQHQVIKMTEITEEIFITSRGVYTQYPISISKSALFKKIKSSEFPKQMRVSNSFHWVKTDIDEFFGLKK